MCNNLLDCYRLKAASQRIYKIRGGGFFLCGKNFCCFSLKSNAVAVGNVSSVIDNFSNSNPLHHRFNHCFSIHLNGFHARFLIFVEVETEQIAFLKVIVIQIFRNLFFSLCVIFLATPDFQLYDILLSQIVYNHISSLLVTRLCFNVIVTCTIDNWSQVQQE